MYLANQAAKRNHNSHKKNHKCKSEIQIYIILFWFLTTREFISNEIRTNHQNTEQLVPNRALE